MFRLGAIAAGVLALVCGAWYVDHAHQARTLAEAKTEQANLKTAIETESRKAQEAADKARSETETEWREKIQNAQTQWSSASQEREAKLRDSLGAANERMRKSTRPSAHRDRAPNGVPDNTAVASRSRLDASVQLPGSIGLDLRYYAATAQQTADALKLCQQSYPSN